MLVKSIEQVEIVKEVQLPYCAKSKNGYAFFRINPDESIVRFSYIKGWGTTDILNTDCGSTYKSMLQEILKECKECSEQEVLETAEKIHRMIDQHQLTVV
jgi:hypothetical protein